MPAPAGCAFLIEPVPDEVFVLEDFGEEARAMASTAQEFVDREVIPRLVEALEGTRRAYERGRYGYFELRAVQADLLSAQSDLVDASAGAHRLVIALERLTGETVAKR